MDFPTSVDPQVIAQFFNKNNLNAGIGEIVMGRSPLFLSATALGSCIGAIIYDKINKIATLAHIALPTVKEAAHMTPEKIKKLPGRFADLAIPASIRMLKRKKVLKLEAKIVGGSNMLDLGNGSEEHLGERNANATIDILKEFGIPIRGRDLNGKSSRTIKFYPENAMMEIKSTVRKSSRYEYTTKVYWL